MLTGLVLTGSSGRPALTTCVSQIAPRASLVASIESGVEESGTLNVGAMQETWDKSKDVQHIISSIQRLLSEEGINRAATEGMGGAANQRGIDAVAPLKAQATGARSRVGVRTRSGSRFRGLRSHCRAPHSLLECSCGYGYALHIPPKLGPGALRSCAFLTLHHPSPAPR